MVRPQVIDLLLPASYPNIFTNKFNSVKRICEERFISAESVILDKILNSVSGGGNEPFSKVRADVYPNSL